MSQDVALDVNSRRTSVNASPFFASRKTALWVNPQRRIGMKPSAISASQRSFTGWVKSVSMMPVRIFHGPRLRSDQILVDEHSQTRALRQVQITFAVHKRRVVHDRKPICVGGDGRVM